MKSSMTGTILRIEKISLNDGNGMRTVVFFKGCPCRCAWCSTPESQNPDREVYFMKQRCRLCGACVAKCPNGALSFSEDNSTIKRDASLCDNCFTCVDVCNYRAQNIYGKEMTVAQLMKEIEKDSIFYFYSNGGVTLSGGDIFCQTDFAEAILEECEDSFIDTCAELDMLTSQENVARIIPKLNTMYIDVKLMDDELHHQWTGVSNKTILENISYADTICKKNSIHIRLPLVEGVNDSHENIQATADYCATLANCVELEFLPYHRLGVHTYEQLQREYTLADREPMTRKHVYDKVSFLLEQKLPYQIRISSLEIYDPVKGIIPVTEEQLTE